MGFIYLWFFVIFKNEIFKKILIFFYYFFLVWLNLSSLFKFEFKVNYFLILEIGVVLYEYKVFLLRMGVLLSIVLRYLFFMFYYICVFVFCYILEVKDRWVCLFYDCSFDFDGIFVLDLSIFFVFKEFFYFFFKE